jgi:hypothetical protein
MKKALLTLALATFAVVAQSQVSFVDGTERPVFLNYNPNGAAAYAAGPSLKHSIAPRKGPAMLVCSAEMPSGLRGA